MLNRYAGSCRYCGGHVPAKGGTLSRVAVAGAKHGGVYLVAHLSCGATGQPEVIVTRFSSGAEVTRNRRGRCEDAPCCGCCT